MDTGAFVADETVANGASLRDRFRAAVGQQTKRVSVELEGKTFEFEVRSLSAAMRRDFAAEDGTLPDVDLVIAGVWDPETGEKAFEPDDKDWLQDAIVGPLDVLAMAVLEVSGLTKAAEAAGKGRSTSTARKRSSSS